MIKDRKSCSRPRARWAHRHRVKPGKANARAVAIRELDSAPLHSTGNGQPARGGEASTRTVDRSEARPGFPGVKGDSARGQNRRELGRTAAAAGALCHGELGRGINNQAGCCGGESEGFIVAMRAGITGQSEGTLVRNMRSPKQPVLIGESLRQRKRPRPWNPLGAETEAGLPDQVLPRRQGACLVEESLLTRAGCGKSARPVRRGGGRRVRHGMRLLRHVLGKPRNGLGRNLRRHASPLYSTAFVVNFLCGI